MRVRFWVTGSSFRLFQWHPICKERLARKFTILHFEVVVFAFHQHNESCVENQFWLNLNFCLMCFNFNCITLGNEQLLVIFGEMLTQSNVCFKRKSVDHTNSITLSNWVTILSYDLRFKYQSFTCDWRKFLHEWKP